MAKKNPYLKTANSEEEYNYEQLQELKKCAGDPIYFIKNYVKIVHPKEGVVPFDLFDYQENMITSFHEEQYTIVLSARQTGKCVGEDTKILVIDKRKIPWYKRLLLRILDKETHGRIFNPVC